MNETPKWTSVVFPSEVINIVREFIKEIKYWPSASAFCREAVLEKMRRERQTLKEVKEARSERGG